MTTYHINPTIKKRWFKPPQLIYELIKYEEEEQWIDPTYDFFQENLLHLALQSGDELKNKTNN